MKRVIRKGVFETNSSSTHSLAFENYCPFDDCDWYVDSVDGKFSLAIDLIDHALYEDSGWRDYYYEEDVAWAMDKLEVCLKENYSDLFIELVNRFGEFKDIPIRTILFELEEKDIEMPEFINENEHMKELWERFDSRGELLLRFRKKLAEEYLKIKKKNTKEEMEKYFYPEPDGHGFACYNWFNEGALYGCNCGLEDIGEVYDKIMDYADTDEKIAKRVKEFFSEDYFFSGKEEW